MSTVAKPSTSSEIIGDPEVFLAIDDLELAGRGIGDSVWAGVHRSSVRAPGVEFESHRDYQPGDDLRRINWSLFARQRRLFTKESHRESLRPVYLLIDATGSMKVHHGKFSKFEYAQRIAAALAFLAVRQGDLPALGILRDHLENGLTPRTGERQAMEICAVLARSKAQGEGDICQALIDSRNLCRKRGFVILISDFFDHENQVIDELATFRAQGHETLALQVLDPIEVKIPPTGDYEFIDAETGEPFRTSAEPLRDPHARVVAEWRADLMHNAANHDLRWDSVTTDDSLIEVARRWLDMV